MDASIVILISIGYSRESLIVGNECRASIIVMDPSRLCLMYVAIYETSFTGVDR